VLVITHMLRPETEKTLKDVVTGRNLGTRLLRTSRFVNGEHTAPFSSKKTGTLWQTESGFVGAVATTKNIPSGSLGIGPEDQGLQAVRADNLFHVWRARNPVGDDSHSLRRRSFRSSLQIVAISEPTS
jgi:hypothetical protein